MVDAAALVEAVMRPNMRFVELRTPEQIDLQALSESDGNWVAALCSYA